MKRINFQKYALFVVSLCATDKLWAQAATVAPKNTDFFNDIMSIVFVVAVSGVFITALWAMVRANAILYKTLLQQQAEASGISFPELEPAPVREGDDFWTRMRKKYWENPIPREREREALLAHNYDGIRELDNSLPPWWLNMFYLTIIWALGYMIYYHWGGNGPSSEQAYLEEMDVAKREVAQFVALKSEVVDEANITALTDGAKLSEGELIYKANCVACHGQAGEGGVGPNLCDPNWIHGGGIENVFKTIKYGVPDKGMIAWSATLRPVDIQKVASYILKFSGTNPPNPKAPQGEIWQAK